MKRFIHIPKTAGTSVKHWICQTGETVLCGDDIITPEKIITKRLHKRGWLKENTEKFTIVRNPYERCVSAYNYLIKENKRVPADTTFEKFIKDFLLDKSNNVDTWRPQIWWLLTKKGTPAVHKIIRFENIEKELQHYFNYYQPMPEKNKSTYKDYNLYYTAEIRNLVKNFYEKDFDYLKYPT